MPWAIERGARGRPEPVVGNSAVRSGPGFHRKGFWVPGALRRLEKMLGFIGFGAMDVTKPYKFIGFGAMDATKPYEFIGLGPWVPPNPVNS